MSKTTRIGDFGADVEADDDAATVPTLPGADVQEVDILLARDDRIRAWERALYIEEDDVEDGEREGVFYVDEELAILVLVESNQWHGWCECDTPEPCAHLCALAQLHELRGDLIPEVSIA